MRVCLINPPSPFLLDERVFMPLGLLRVGAVLEAKGHEVEVLDLAGRSASVDRAPRADLYGITATTAQMPAAVKIIQQLLRRGRRVILGGPHVTLVCSAARQNSPRRQAILGLADLSAQGVGAHGVVMVAGDGEKAILEALTPSLIGGVVNADDPESPLFLTNADLETLPFAARHLVDMGSYHYQIDGVRALSVIAQLGCPFGCGFCGGRSSPSLRRIRTRSAARVIEELEHLYKAYGCRGFMFMDDELNVNPAMVGLMDGIRDAQRRLGTTFRLRGFIKAELFNDRQAEAMYAAGFREILVGFESGSERILKNIEKRATGADNTRCVATAKRHGLRVKALLSLGHPGETFKTVQETKDWLLEVCPHDFDATIITPYPGTPYYDQAVQNPDYGADIWTYRAKTGDALHMEDVDFLETAEYYKGVPGSYVSHVFTDTLLPGDLVDLRDNLEAVGRAALGCPPPRRHESSMGAGWTM